MVELSATLSSCLDKPEQTRITILDAALAIMGAEVAVLHVVLLSNYIVNRNRFGSFLIQLHSNFIVTGWQVAVLHVVNKQGKLTRTGWAQVQILNPEILKS